MALADDESGFANCGTWCAVRADIPFLREIAALYTKWKDSRYYEQAAFHELDPPYVKLDAKIWNSVENLPETVIWHLRLAQNKRESVLQACAMAQDAWKMKKSVNIV
jgi:hypothetical protein